MTTSYVQLRRLIPALFLLMLLVAVPAAAQDLRSELYFPGYPAEPDGGDGIYDDPRERLEFQSQQAAEGYITSYEFGVVEVGERRRGEISVVNTGTTPLTLMSLDNGLYVDWNDPSFSIDDATLASLVGLKVEPDMSVRIPVTFIPAQPGPYRASARFGSSAGTLTTEWAGVGMVTFASVSQRSAQASGLKHLGANPFTGSTDIALHLGSGGATRIVIYDAMGTQIATLVDAYLPAGERTVRWDAGGVSSGVYYCRATSGSWSATVPLVVR